MLSGNLIEIFEVLVSNSFPSNMEVFITFPNGFITNLVPRVRRLGAGHDSGETEYRISNFGYPVSCAHAHAQTATLNLRGRH